MRALIDTRLRSSIPEMWPSKCSIQRISFTNSASGQPIPTGAANIRALVNIPCRMGPLIELRPTDAETLTDPVTGTFQRRQCKLNLYAPLISPLEMQAVVDGVIYPIRGVESDSQDFSTRLSLEIKEP